MRDTRERKRDTFFIFAEEEEVHVYNEIKDSGLLI
jgi:hypothetical protein